MNLDEAVLAQSLADTTAVMSRGGGEPQLAQQTAVAMLLERDDSDDEEAQGKEALSSAVSKEHAKPGP